MHTNVLVTRDNKSKFRIIYLNLLENENKDLYTIKRSSGIFNGKLTDQPELKISKGKVKRTLQQQAELEYNSLLKKYLDKGYKDVTEYSNLLNEELLNTLIPTNKTDQNNALKPQLCKVLDKTNKNLTDKEWYASYKHDGVRALLFIKDGVIKTSSRGGQDYDVATTYIRQDPYLISVLTNNPTLVLDGEIYKHGWTLNKISGLCRKETLENDHQQLEFRCYDIVDENKAFKDRLKILNELKSNQPNNSKLVIVEHYKISGLTQIMNLHNTAVQEGYEGLVIRDPDKVYKCGSRDRMYKIKEFIDDEFEITGLSEGLREEDLCFTLKTKEGFPFKAKPMGTREDKQWYRDHISELIGKFGTVKYFGFTNTENPVPNLPVFKAVRDEKDK